MQPPYMMVGDTTAPSQEMTAAKAQGKGQRDTQQRGADKRKMATPASYDTSGIRSASLPQKPGVKQAQTDAHCHSARSEADTKSRVIQLKR